MRFINREGQTIRGITILKELVHGKVIGQCMYCGDIKEYSRNQVVVTGMSSCGCLKSIQGKMFGHMIVTKELDNNRVKAMCIDCKHEYQYDKRLMRRNEAACRNKGCKNYISMRIINRVGEIYNKIRIVKELGNNKVLTECIECGSRHVFTKSSLIKGIGTCKNPECPTRLAKRVDNGANKVEKWANRLVIEEMHGGKVRTVCKACGAVKVYDNIEIMKGIDRCINPECNYFERGLSLIYRVGEVYNNLKIVKELGYNRIEAECVDCGYTGEYDKYRVVRNLVSCRNCR